MAAACALLAAACATSTPSEPPPDPGPFDRSEYVIGPADVVRVQVWKNADLSATVPVRPDGKISLPLLDDVQAAGLTALELKEVVTEALSEYVAAPDVAVIVAEVNSKQVFIVGEVQRPAALPLSRDMRVLDAIATVGGFNAFADKSEIRVLRPDGNGGVIDYRFDYDAFTDGRHPDANILLAPGDTIVVPD